MNHCKDCKYFGYIDAEAGFCTRYPPLFIGNPTYLRSVEPTSWVSPVVEPLSHCGEFAFPKPKLVETTTPSLRDESLESIPTRLRRALQRGGIETLAKLEQVIEHRTLSTVTEIGPANLNAILEWYIYHQWRQAGKCPTLT